MNCKKCNGEMYGIEYMGAYDGILERKCQECGYREHRSTGLEIISSRQEENYGNAYFELEGNRQAKNRNLLENNH